MVDIKEQLSNMNKISKRSVAYYHKFAISIGISDSSLGILYSLLEANKPCSQYDLCNELFMPKQTINTAVNVLKDKGLISITPSQESRNKKILCLPIKVKILLKIL